MRKTLLLAALAATFCTADLVTAQRGGGGGAGGGGRNRWRRPDEVTNRVEVRFTDVAAPEVDGDKIADLGTIPLVRAAAAANQPTLLYLFDGEADERARERFESSLFRSDAGGDELSLRLRCVHCGMMDISKAAPLKERYGKQAPLFVAFDKAGDELRPVSMAGFKADTGDLEGLLDKAGKGAFKPSLKSFAKKYADLVRDLEQVLRQKERVEEEKSRADGDKSKIKKADKELEKLQKEQDKLLEKEKELTEDVRMPAPGEKKLGGRRDRGGRGGAGNGRGGNGRGGNGGGNNGGGGNGRGGSGRGGL